MKKTERLKKSLRYYFKSQEVQKDLRMALSGRLCQQMFYLACAFIHIIMIIIFYGYGVDAMMYYNIASVVFYIGFFTAVTAIKNRTVSLVDIALAEIMVFSVAATVAVGWGCGFALYLICIVPAPFFMPYERISTSIFSSVVIAAAFISTRIYVSNPKVLTHAVESADQAMKMYIFNSVMAILMITFMAVMFVVSRNISTKMMNEKAEELIQLASVDPLTQLFNRRAMTEYIKAVHEAAEDSGKSYSVILGDIDNFKKINDNYGHALGDEVLKKVSETITNNVPSEGYICRWGGEEILFIIPECREERAGIICEQIRNDISLLRFTSHGVEFRVSMTFGLAMADLNKDYETSINTADNYLYCGKENGKNIVVTQKAFERLSAK